MGIHAVIVYFDLCLLICIMIFMSIASFKIIIIKRDEQQSCAGFLKICKYTFIVFEKGDKQKIGQAFLKFVSMLFNLIIFSVKMSYRDVWGLHVCFL